MTDASVTMAMPEREEAVPTRSAFESDGYVVFRSLVSSESIDSLLEIYHRKMARSAKPFFRQSINAWETNKFTKAGNVIEPFLDIHDMRDPEFEDVCRLAREILCHCAIRDAIATITGEPEHSLMQSMLFDHNAATPAHQDGYYLDSVPNGRLLAGWFAMEDIDERAGRFFVLPGSNSHLFDLTADESTSNELYQKRMRSYTREHATELRAPALKKGDVLFWHSRTIHGSLPTLDENFSRKSLTAHYMPSACRFGNMRGREYPVRYLQHEGMPYRYVERKYSLGHQFRSEFYNRLSNKYPKAYRMWRRVRRHDSA